MAGGPAPIRRARFPGQFKCGSTGESRAPTLGTMLLVSALWPATNRLLGRPPRVTPRSVLCPAPEPAGRIWGRRHCRSPPPCGTLTDVSETARCPRCGAAVPDGDAPGGAAAQAGTGERGLAPLYQEVRRIREIAEARDAGEGGRRVAELTREVEELRATVARLRGAAVGTTVRA